MYLGTKFNVDVEVKIETEFQRFVSHVVFIRSSAFSFSWPIMASGDRVLCPPRDLSVILLFLKCRKVSILSPAPTTTGRDRRLSFRVGFCHWQDEIAHEQESVARDLKVQRMPVVIGNERAVVTLSFVTVFVVCDVVWEG
ncbi:hypothetical protein PTI98_011801 [Pleurotus ostreatus]|nr:hypothetical protein PTI98_011801 [Pleurotus ostreatus]